jgi:general secretion pathway protein M
MKALNPLRTQAVARWQALSSREQRGVTALGVLLALLLFWSIAIAPALNTLHDIDNRRVQIGQQQAQMLVLQNQAQALQARTPLSRNEALRTLQGFTPSPQIQLQVQGERILVQLKAVPAPALAHWLTQARHQTQVLPVEAHLTRGNAAATSNTATAATANSAVVWDGNLILSLPSQGASARQ